MTDIREKVAMAICTGMDGDPCQRPNEFGICSEMMRAADAALTACGWQEIVEALEYVLMDVENNEYALSTHARQLIDAALSKARGET